MDEELKALLNGRPLFTRLERYDADAVLYDHVAAAVKHKVTDVIELSTADVKELLEIVLNIREGDRARIPSDIIFANTLPLKDFTVVQKTEYHDKYESITFTFNICDEYTTFHTYVQEDHNPDEPRDVVFASVYPDKLTEYYALREKDFDFTSSNFGTLTIAIRCNDGWTTKFVLPMECNHQYIMPSRMLYSYEAGGKSIIQHFMNGHYVKLPEDLESELYHWAHLGITIYYAIMVALLNPCIKEVFLKNSSAMPMSTGKATGRNKRAKIRYVKRHIMNAADIKNAFEKRGFIRRTMIWYVTGHWREYKNGKRIFIQGYWKGALRDIKAATDLAEERDREIVVPENKEKDNDT